MSAKFSDGKLSSHYLVLHINSVCHSTLPCLGLSDWLEGSVRSHTGEMELLHSQTLFLAYSYWIIQDRHDC